MVAKVKVFKDGEYIFIPLQQAINEYRSEAPTGWYQYIEEIVDKALNIKTEEEYQWFLKRMNLRWFKYEEVKTLYQSLKKSKYNDMFDDDILKFIAYMYGMGYFRQHGYPIDIHNPNLDRWLNIQGLFETGINGPPPEYAMFSLMDLVGLKNGQNAIRGELIFAPKWW